MALAAGIPYGGWCPRGGWAEDLPEPPGLLELYPQLSETPGADPEQRTRWNVRDSDATLILTAGEAPSPGTALAIATAVELSRELAVLHLSDVEAGLDEAQALLAALPHGGSLNVAGPRESESPRIYERALALLAVLLGSGR